MARILGPRLRACPPLTDYSWRGQQIPLGVVYRPLFLPLDRDGVSARLHTEVVVLEWVALAGCYARLALGAMQITKIGPVKDFFPSCWLPNRSV